MSIRDLEVTMPDGTVRRFGDIAPGAALVVNVASKCGFTPQYGGLEELHQEFGPQGLTVVGLPCNQFMMQEPGTAAEIGEFCQVNYGVTFPMMAKIDVNGDDADPVYKWLTSQAKGFLGTKGIKWNFTKFLVGRDGEVIERFGPQDEPEKMREAIEAALEMATA